jgi:phage terminase large subunit-like protein
MLQELERRKKENPLKYLKQHRKQYEASLSDKIIRGLFWGNRVGKTEWGAQETSRFIAENKEIEVEVYDSGESDEVEFVGRKVLPNYRTHDGPVDLWVGSPSFDLQRDGPQKKLELYLPPNQIQHIEYLRSNIWKEVTLKDGTKMGFKSYEQSAGKWQSAGKDWIWFDEEPPYEIWEEASVREEAGKQLRIIITMTAVKGMTWVYDKLYTNTKNQNIFISEAGWDDNPWLLNTQKDRMAGNLTPEALEVRKKGRFVKRVGLVCPWFNRSTHIKHYSELDRSWTWYESLDGGFSDPLCYELIGVDHDNSIHVVNGFREAQLLTADIKQRIKTIRGNLTITGSYSDNDNPRLLEELRLTDPNNPIDISLNFMAIEKKAGESKSWDESLAEKLAEYGQIQKGTGLPRLYISDNLVRFDEQIGEQVNWLQRELEVLTWSQQDKKSGMEIQPKWDDHRRFKHHFDGTRTLAYFVMSYQKPITESQISSLPQFQAVWDEELGL